MKRYRFYIYVILLVLLLSSFGVVLSAPSQQTYTSDLMTTSCLLASSTVSGFLSYLADDDINSAWTGSGTMPQWVRCDFAGTPRLIRQISMRVNAPSNAPSDYSVQYSDNASTWTTVATIGPEIGWSFGERRVHAWGPVGVHARYWRILISSTQGGGTTLVVIKEVEMFEVVSEDDPTATPTTGPTNTPVPTPTSTAIPDMLSSVQTYNDAMQQSGLSGYLGIAFLIVLILMIFFGLARKG